MTNSGDTSALSFTRGLWCAALIFFPLVLTLVATPSARAQGFSVIHSFTGGGDGETPGGLTSDAAGNLYGTTTVGGAGYGIVFKLKHVGAGWILTPLYTFAGGSDGAYPSRRVSIASDGTLYDTTHGGGIYGIGTVFHMMPSPTAPASALVPWNESVLHSFNGSDGLLVQDDLVFDQTRSLYGTTYSAGFPYCDSGGCGLVYRLTPSVGGWTETPIYSFQPSEGAHPVGGLVFDHTGNLYGATVQGGPSGYGVIYRLSPTGSTWTEQALHTFAGGTDGGYPTGGLIMDASGNLYGMTTCCGSNGGGTAFELVPGSGGWTFNVLYAFQSCCGADLSSRDKLAMDSAGNLYGTFHAAGRFAFGSVFKLTFSDGRWGQITLHDFTGGTDGQNPSSAPVFGTNGRLYGTADGGAYGKGVVWEITP